MRYTPCAPFATSDAPHLAKELFGALEGELRVCGDTILVSYYNAPHVERLREHFEHLPSRLDREGIDPRVPWLYGLEVDFRFRMRKSEREQGNRSPHTKSPGREGPPPSRKPARDGLNGPFAGLPAGTHRRTRAKPHPDKHMPTTQPPRRREVLPDHRRQALAGAGA